MPAIHALFLICIALFCASVQTLRFDTRCKLVREMIKVGVPKDIFLGQWVCLIEKVSNRDTKALVVTSSGKTSYGLYQIPSRWCRPGKKGGECNIACESLLDDDIRDDTACAVSIFEKEGFKYWPLWTVRCKNDNSTPYYTREIYKCPDLMIQSRASVGRELFSDKLRKRQRLIVNRTELMNRRYLGVHA